MTWNPMSQSFDPPAPTTHDYGPEHRAPGHDVAVTAVDGSRVKVTGWGTGIRQGDFVLLPSPNNPSGRSRYEVKAIRYYTDPQDMWAAEMQHAPARPAARG